jgi:hypothetical protein
LDALLAAVAELPEQHARYLRYYRHQMLATLAGGSAHDTCKAFREVWDQCERHDESLILVRAALLADEDIVTEVSRLLRACQADPVQCYAQTTWLFCGLERAGE